MTADAFLMLDGAGDGAAGRWPLVDGATIGRSSEADVVVAVDEVSRVHARVDRRPNGWWLVDLGSRNGTHVAGRAVTDEPVRLDDGDTVTLAGRVRLRFVDVLATPAVPRIGRISGLWIDPDTRAVWVDAQRVEPPLSARQLDLLELLYDHEGDVLDRPTIVARVWSDVAAEGVSDDAVAALVKRVRSRLRDYEREHRYVDVVRTRGVRFRQPG